MDTRREFFRKAAQLAGAAGLTSSLLPAITKAAAIEPTASSTYLDAEHVVILMQENRSFDHAFGTLRGVRGFGDPRPITLPNGHPVWLQTNAAGETYAPFRLDAQRTNATWLGSLPHSWTDQNDAKNHGDHDRWLIAKPAGREDISGMPLTMGYYTREDLPFYYALADAFTVCDQYFCSSLTGTTPNRLYLWSGTIREQQNPPSWAKVRNENVDFGVPAHWTTFPERLEDAGVSWKIYQNEIDVASGLSEIEERWLANFSDNPIEWFPQYAVEYAEQRRAYVRQLLDTLPEQIRQLEGQPDQSQQLVAKRALLKQAEQERDAQQARPWESLDRRTHALHTKAFTNNASDPEYRSLTKLDYHDGTAERSMDIPKGDVLFQFRQDVNTGKLPAVSWIVAPETFSDHPTAAWYGAWYLAEVLNILTHNPEVWRKTIFILTYDENDGFFDHVPPFGAPDPNRPETGTVTGGIDPVVEYVPLQEDLERHPPERARGGSIGLGFRVPFVIASPWSRGGAVCSQVFDHTSVIQFLEQFASRKAGKPIQETNITTWRRTVCGDLSSVFCRSEGTTSDPLPYATREAFLERIHKAQFQAPPPYQALTAEQIKNAGWKPQQEPGTRPARALPYELSATGQLTADRRSFELTLAAGNSRFGRRAAGSPFLVYAPTTYLHDERRNRVRNYAVGAGSSIQDRWKLDGFVESKYQLRVCGPNGFSSEFAGDMNDPLVEVLLEGPAGNSDMLQIVLRNNSTRGSLTAIISDNSYGMAPKRHEIGAGKQIKSEFDLAKSSCWYDFTITIDGSPMYWRRYAGHLENGLPSTSDPAMGRIVV